MEKLITNKDVTIKTRLTTFTAPKGSGVERNQLSHTGYFLKPSNFMKNTMQHHNATFYGYPIDADDVAGV